MDRLDYQAALVIFTEGELADIQDAADEHGKYIMDFIHDAVIDRVVA